MKSIVSFIFKRILGAFWYLHKFLVFKNKKLKNKHKGETCFILGNGSSLKYYDLSKISNRFPAIVCSYSLIDKRIEGLNIQYFVVAETYFLYSLLYNARPLTRGFQKNKMKPIFEKILHRFQNITTIISITNFYSSVCRKVNVNYFHHFGDRYSSSYDLAGVFSTCTGSIDMMFGLAKYLGFSKAIALGCDYLSVPPMQGHFYGDYDPFTGDEKDTREYRARVKKMTEGLDILLILPEGFSSTEFVFDSYENFFGIQKKYQKNYEFIDSEYLELLRSAEKLDQAIITKPA
jgi:hypothetical protein